MSDSSFGARLRLMRESRDWSMRDLAQTTGLSKGYIVKLENKATNPTLDTVGRLAAGLGCSAAWLAFGREGTAG